MRATYTKLGSLFAIALAACAALHAPHAAAQAQNGQRCPTIDNDAERLACYDRALRPPAPSTPAPPTPAAAAAAPSTAVATENRATRPERAVRESTATAAPAAPAPPAAPAAPAPPAAPAAPAVRRAPAPAKAELAIVPIVIVQIRALPGRPATFVTDSGETWVQTDGQRKWPAAPFKAAIKVGAMGSSFLVPDDYAHSFRVVRGR